MVVAVVAPLTHFRLPLLRVFLALLADPVLTRFFLLSQPSETRAPLAQQLQLKSTSRFVASFQWVPSRSCAQCLLGVFVCKKHLLLCGSLKAAQRCRFCNRVLCTARFCAQPRGVFLLGGRDEEQNSRNQVVVRQCGLGGPVGGSFSLSALSHPFIPSQEPLSSLYPCGRGASDFHSVSSGDPAPHDRRATAMLRSPPCTKTGRSHPLFLLSFLLLHFFLLLLLLLRFILILHFALLLPL